MKKVVRMGMRMRFRNAAVGGIYVYGASAQNADMVMRLWAEDASSGLTTNRIARGVVPLE